MVGAGGGVVVKDLRPFAPNDWHHAAENDVLPQQHPHEKLPQQKHPQQQLNEVRFLQKKGGNFHEDMWDEVFSQQPGLVQHNQPADASAWFGAEDYLDDARVDVPATDVYSLADEYSYILDDPLTRARASMTDEDDVYGAFPDVLALEQEAAREHAAAAAAAAAAAQAVMGKEDVGRNSLHKQGGMEKGGVKQGGMQRQGGVPARGEQRSDANDLSFGSIPRKLDVVLGDAVASDENTGNTPAKDQHHGLRMWDNPEDLLSQPLDSKAQQFRTKHPLPLQQHEQQQAARDAALMQRVHMEEEGTVSVSNPGIPVWLDGSDEALLLVTEAGGGLQLRDVLLDRVGSRLVVTVLLDGDLAQVWGLCVSVLYAFCMICFVMCTLHKHDCMKYSVYVPPPKKHRPVRLSFAWSTFEGPIAGAPLCCLFPFPSSHPEA